MAWAPAGQAHGAGGRSTGILCEGPSRSVYDPPLTLQAKETRVHTDADYQCTVGPGRTVRATGTLDGVSPDAACAKVSRTRVTETVEYEDDKDPKGSRNHTGTGSRSVIDYHRGITVRAAGLLIVRLTGRVTEGRGKGQEAERTVFLAAARGLPTECLSSGIDGSDGRAQLEIKP
ncbi:hypothetical protein [Streptomyces abikoensis]